MSWWKQRQGVFVFNPQDGTYAECELIARDGINRSIVRGANGLEVSANDEFITKDPEQINILRRKWEATQAKLQQSG